MTSGRISDNQDRSATSDQMENPFSSSQSGSGYRPGTSRSAISSTKFDVKKFVGTNNFGMWQCEVLDVLIQHELDFTLEDNPDEINDKDWDQINRQAYGFIRLCLAKDQKYFVMREAKAKDLWKKLEDKFMSKSVENRLYLKKKLFRFSYIPGTIMMEHLTDYNKILADLQNLDVEILGEDKAILLLNSLPDQYDHLSTTLMYEKNTIKYDDVSIALMNNEYRKKDKQANKDSSSEALSVRGRSEKKQGGK